MKIDHEDYNISIHFNGWGILFSANDACSTAVVLLWVVVVIHQKLRPLQKINYRCVFLMFLQ